MKSGFCVNCGKPVFYTIDLDGAEKTLNLNYTNHSKTCPYTTTSEAKKHKPKLK